jgi:hypothetical protein
VPRTNRLLLGRHIFTPPSRVELQTIARAATSISPEGNL